MSKKLLDDTGNIVDPGQMYSKASDLGLQYLLRLSHLNTSGKYSIIIIFLISYENWCCGFSLEMLLLDALVEKLHLRPSIKNILFAVAGP